MLADMQVFISYSSRDRVEALQLKALVDELGHDAWMDVFDLRAGAPLTSELKQKVTESGALLLLLSPFAVETRWVADEIHYAREAQKKSLLFVPVILRPARIPDALGDLLAIDARRGLDEETFRLRLVRALGGEIDQSLILNAEMRAALADRALVEEAESALPGLKEDIGSFLDQPIRKLRVVIDHRTWPTPDPSMLQIQMRVDIFKADASVFLAPYVEGATWHGEQEFEERAPDGFFGKPKPRIDARFSFLGRRRSLGPVSDGTDLGELPVEFGIELDGSEFTGEERARTMLLAERFELPSIRTLMDKGSSVALWRQARGEQAIAVDPHTTDIDLRLYAVFETNGMTHNLRLWSSRRSRDEIVLEKCQTLAECKSPIEREILLDAFYPRPLRAAETSSNRRERIGKALDKGEPVPMEDGWAAFRMMRGASDVMAIRGQFPQAAEELHKALGHLPEDLALDRDFYGAMFEYWNAVMRLAALLEKSGGAEDALRFYADEGVRVADEAANREPKEPDFQRAVARSLIHRVGLFQRRFGIADVGDLDRADQIMDELAAEADFPWRAQEATETHARTNELRGKLGAEATAEKVSQPPVFAKWLDPRAQSNESKVLLMSALLRYSAFVSERVPWSGPELHLVGREIIHAYRSDTEPGWFWVSVAETGADDPKPPTMETALECAPFGLTMDAAWEVLKWEPTEQIGDLAERLKLDEAHAFRALFRKDGSLLRVYLLDARTRLLRWRVSLGLPAESDDWQNVARDDASAAITFARLNLG